MGEQGDEGGEGGTRRARRRTATALLRARVYARRSMLPPPAERARHPWTMRATVAFRFVGRLVRRVVADRVSQRAAALAFGTLLSVVPILAVTFALLSRWGGTAGSQGLVRALAERYFPRATDGATEAVLGLVTRSEIAAAGFVALVLLLPVMTGLVRQAESALADIFRAPPLPTFSLRFFVHAALAVGAPLLAVFGARYLPHFAAGGAFQLVDTHLLPLAGSTLALFLLYAYLPGRHVGKGWALVGALCAALLLEAGKLGFSVYVTYLGGGLHLVWGAVAFMPLLLVWVFLTWLVVLLGAEVAAAAHELEGRLEAGVPARHRRPMQGGRRRLRRKVAWREEARRAATDTERGGA